MDRLKPILLKIVLKKGAPIYAAKIEYDLPKIAGFLAIESEETPNATTYVALDNIASFTVLNAEAPNIPYAFESRVKVKIDDSFGG